MVRRGTAGQAWQGPAGYGKAWHGAAGKARLGPVWPGAVGQASDDQRMDLDALIYTDEAAALANVSTDRIRRWACSYPDVMPVRDRGRHNRPRYRAGDVLEVERATRTGRRLTA